MLSRRAFSFRAATLVLAESLVRTPPILASTVTRRCPLEPVAFESGDFLWPKPPGVIIPYEVGRPAQFAAARTIWNEEKARFLQDVSRKNSYFAEGDIEYLRKLTFEEFYRRYDGALGDRQFPQPRGGPIYVGHVALVERPGRDPTLIEAVSDEGGVVRATYSSWLARRAGEKLWWGRVRGFSAEQRAGIAVEAARYLGATYDFWNFDLADTRGFYCSKLAWLCVANALRIAVDGNPNPQRSFWFSPKQLLHCAPVHVLCSPGPY
jgi:hypothetical protein